MELKDLNQRQMTVYILYMALTAPDESKGREAIKIASQVSDGMSEEELELCKMVATRITSKAQEYEEEQEISLQEAQSIALDEALKLVNAYELKS